MQGRLFAIFMLVGLLAPAAAPAAEPLPDLRRRVDELVLVLRGEEAPEAFFAPSFLAHVPPDQMRGVAEKLRQTYGRPASAPKLEARSDTAGTVTVDYEKATARMELVLDPTTHLATGLLVTAVEAKAETLAALAPAFRALPGASSVAAARLGGPAPEFVLAENAEQPLAVGSDFKLFILAELVREVKAGQRRWSDVVPLSARSLPSGTLHTWPQGAPITLHTLASLMISQSDNTAADTLLDTLGRARVEQLLPELGVRAAARNRPFLSTREAFLLKAGDPAWLAAWKAGDEARRRALLSTLSGTSAAGLDPRRFLGGPIAIREVEWFASPADLVRTLDWIRRSGDRTALDILAINPGLPAAKDFSYLGYKGGSEAGVLAMAFLARRNDGTWIAAAAAWNNLAAPVDEAQFAALMSRMLTLLR